MDFLKILKSFEEFVYEALTWILLLPRTLTRIAAWPQRMTDYAAAELKRSDEARFSDAVSPPLLLILCVFIAHLVDLRVRSQEPSVSGSLASVIFASEEYLLLYRTIAFGVWALAGATYLLVSTRQPVNRESLRIPFYEQCYLVAPFALLLSISTSLLFADYKGTAVILVIGGTLWFWIAQALWISHKRRLPIWRSGVAATVIILAGAAINAGVGRVLSHTDAPETSASATR